MGSNGDALSESSGQQDRCGRDAINAAAKAISKTDPDAVAFAAAAAAVDAVDPIIRADERKHIAQEIAHEPGWGNVLGKYRASIEAEVRERIAEAIEADYQMIVSEVPLESRTFGRWNAYRRTAAIARGGESDG